MSARLLPLLLPRGVAGAFSHAGNLPQPSLPRKAGTASLLGAAALLALCGRSGRAQCPALGADTACGTVITVTDAGVTLSTTGQGPYLTNAIGPKLDGSLVGVINDSSQTISSLDLRSPYDIFAFLPGQGIDFFGAPGNPYDNPSLGYGGPNAYFDNIDPLQQAGTVNFVDAIPAGGGMSYFSLANDLAQVGSNSCAAAITNTVTLPANGGTNVISSFTPNNGLTLSQAASACGFDSWNWQQLLTYLPTPSPFYDAYDNYLSAPLPFNDPPASGYAYQYTDRNTGGIPNAVGLPIYYNTTGTPAFYYVARYESANSLTFGDNPADHCLYGGDPSACNAAYPGGPTLAPQGEAVAFSTHLVGLIGTDLNAEVVDTGVGFAYTDSFNGTSGGVSTLNNLTPVDPGSGTGGILVTGSSTVTARRFPQSLTVEAVNHAPAASLPPLKLLPKAQMTATASGLAYSRATKSFMAR